VTVNAVRPVASPASGGYATAKSQIDAVAMNKKMTILVISYTRAAAKAPKATAASRVNVKSFPRAREGAETGGAPTVGGGFHEHEKLAKMPPGSTSIIVVVNVRVVVVVIGVSDVIVTVDVVLPSTTVDVDVTVEAVTTSSTAVMTCTFVYVFVTV
jgi:hypothetical protein